MRDEQMERLRHEWYTNSTWGLRRKQRIIRWCLWGIGAVIGITLAFLLSH